MAIKKIKAGKQEIVITSEHTYYRPDFVLIFTNMFSHPVELKAKTLDDAVIEAIGLIEQSINDWQLFLAEAKKQIEN